MSLLGRIMGFFRRKPDKPKPTRFCRDCRWRGYWAGSVPTCNKPGPLSDVTGETHRRSKWITLEHTRKWECKGRWFEPREVSRIVDRFLETTRTP